MKQVIQGSFGHAGEAKWQSRKIKGLRGEWQPRGITEERGPARCMNGRGGRISEAADNDRYFQARKIRGKVLERIDPQEQAPSWTQREQEAPIHTVFRQARRERID